MLNGQNGCTIGQDNGDALVHVERLLCEAVGEIKTADHLPGNSPGQKSAVNLSLHPPESRETAMRATMARAWLRRYDSMIPVDRQMRFTQTF
jgi:hypothetical protein